MKAHIGSDTQGRVRSVAVTDIVTDEHIDIFAEAWDKTMAAAEGGGYQQWF